MSSPWFRKPLRIGGVLLMTGALAAAAAPSEKGEEAAAAASTESPGDEGASKAPRSRRPVMAPGQDAPAAPPAAVPIAAPRVQEVEAPQPVAPLTFEGEDPAERADAKEPTHEEEAGAVAEAPGIENPGEVRYSVRRGNFHYVLSVRPGAPRPGDAVELSWSIQEQLLIPDPYLGDRKPLTGVELVAKVSGPTGNATYLAHPGNRPGVFGHHFTPQSEGPHKIALSRKDGKRGIEVELVVPVGAPPLPASRDLGVVVLPASPLDTSSVSALMKELGQRWMRLERSAGTQAAAAAHGELVEFVQQMHAGAPDEAKPGMARLVAGMQAIPAAANRQQTLEAMDGVSFEQCLRCHAAARFEFAKDTARWPAFTPNDELRPPSTPDSTIAPSRRGPLVPGR